MLAKAAFGCYIIALVYKLFFDSVYRFAGYRSYNVIPFETISAMISNYSHVPNVVIINIPGNILAFVPLGLLVPLIFSGFENIKRILLLGAGTGLAAELIQFIFAVGAFGLDDIILNSIGVLFGLICYRLIIRASINLKGNNFDKV